MRMKSEWCYFQFLRRYTILDRFMLNFRKLARSWPLRWCLGIDLQLGLPTTPKLIPGGDSLFIDGRKLAAGETFFGVLDARII